MKFSFIRSVFCFFIFFSPFSFAKTVLINGAGATFPYILYSKWFYEYSKVNPHARINYRSIGSGGGIRQLLKGTLDFSASDVPMKKSELEKSKRNILHIPTTLSAVVLTYNLPGSTKKILLTPSLIAQTFDGSIKKWNDPLMVKVNPHLSSFNESIVVVYRADGSGTTAIFTEYLSKSYPNWNIGHGKSINWPHGIGGKGNEGVLGLVKKIKGSISYIGMSYALKQNLPIIHIQNQDKKFITPSVKTVQAAANASLKKNESYLEPIIDPKGADVYPISAFTFLLIYQQMPSKTGGIILDFLKWALKAGQNFNKNLYYVPLPKNVIQEAQKVIDTITLEDKKA